MTGTSFPICNQDWYFIPVLQDMIGTSYPISSQDWYFITVSAVMSVTSYPILTISRPVFHSCISGHDWYLLSYPFSIHDRYLLLYQLSWRVHPILSCQYHGWNVISVSVVMTKNLQSYPMGILRLEIHVCISSQDWIHVCISSQDWYILF